MSQTAAIIVLIVGVILLVIGCVALLIASEAYGDAQQARADVSKEVELRESALQQVHARIDSLAVPEPTEPHTGPMPLLRPVPSDTAHAEAVVTEAIDQLLETGQVVRREFAGHTFSFRSEGSVKGL